MNLNESATDAASMVDGLNLFGFSLVSSNNKNKINKNKKKEEIAPESFVGPSQEDGSALFISAGEHQVAYHDLGAYYGYSDVARIVKYREISNYPEVDQGIEEIVNELITIDDQFQAVEISLDETDGFPEKVKKTIEEEFQNILSLLAFSTNAYDIARKWYIDGRLVYHVILNEAKTEIVELRPIDPIHIKKVKEVEEITDPKTRIKTFRAKEEYFVYSEANDPSATRNTTFGSSYTFGGSSGNSNTGLKISKDSIVYVPSGLLDESRKNVISYLHKAIKVANQLRMMEDSLVIYRMVRAPERRVFRIDVGGLPAKKAEAYIQNIIAKYRNKITYDHQTGELMDARQSMAMIEDFWLPSRSGAGGTQIDTLSSGETLGQLDDVLYFQKKLFRALNVPLNRLEQESQFSLGRSSEITRDEVKFSKFISKLRSKFSDLFYQLLRTQLILKNIITADEWFDLKEHIFIDFLKDNYFTELKEAEILKERLSTLREIDDYVGKYFSKEWIQRNVLRQSDNDIEEITKQIEAEKKAEADFATNAQNEVPFNG